MAVLLDQKQERKITKLRRRQKKEGIQIRYIKCKQISNDEMKSERRWR